MEKKLAFFTDHVFKVDENGERFSEGKIVRSTFSRYLAISSTVKVICREEKIQEEKTKLYSPSSTDGVDFFSLTGKTWWQILVVNGFKNLKAVNQFVKECDFNVIRCPAFVSLLFLPLVLVNRKKYAVEVVADTYEAVRSATRGHLFSLPLAMFMHVVSLVLVRYATGAIYVTESVLQRKYPSLGLVSSASNVEIEPVSEEVLARRLARPSSGNFKIGVIGSFNNKYKGIDFLTRALADRSLSGTKITLEIVGSGNIENLAIPEEMVDKVILRGSLTKSEVLNWLDSLDLYCQPSRTEGLPRALIEAMSRGCPALATSVGGIPELLDARYISAPDDVENFVALLRSFFSTPNLSKEMALYNFQKAKLFYDDILKGKRMDFFIKYARVVSD